VAGREELHCEESGSFGLEGVEIAAATWHGGLVHEDEGLAVLERGFDLEEACLRSEVRVRVRVRSGGEVKGSMSKRHTFEVKYPREMKIRVQTVSEMHCGISLTAFKSSTLRAHTVHASTYESCAKSMHAYPSKLVAFETASHAVCVLTGHASVEAVRCGVRDGSSCGMCAQWRCGCGGCGAAFETRRAYSRKICAPGSIFRQRVLRWRTCHVIRAQGW
jgi:hypothetical protein